jgi:16S rRNA (uracil1498-N3)-methyltransferase
MGTELGVSKFVVFPAIRSIVRWDSKKVSERFLRLESIIREAAEQSFRTILPTLEWQPSLKNALAAFPNSFVLSELENEGTKFSSITRTLDSSSPVSLVVGPEGGWDPKEQEQFKGRGVSLGPLVLRTDTAGIAAASAILLP